MRHLIMMFLVAVFLVHSPRYLLAAMVKYVDRQGKTHYVNTDFVKVPEEYKDQIPKPASPEKQQAGIPPSEQIPTRHFTRDELVQRLQGALAKMKERNISLMNILKTDKLVFFDAEMKPREMRTDLSDVPDDELINIEHTIYLLEQAVSDTPQKPVVPQLQLEIFGQAGCAPCLELITLLKAKGVNFYYRDLTYSPEGADLRSKNPGPIQVPAARINGNRVIQNVDWNILMDIIQPKPQISPSGPLGDTDKK